MSSLPLLLVLWANAPRVDVVDEIYTIPPSEWRYVPMELKQTPVGLHCDFEVLGKASEVHVALLNQANLERLRADQPHGILADAPPEVRGSFSYVVQAPAEYAIVVDNRAPHAPVRVRLRISLDFSGRPVQGVRYLSHERRLAVILISFAAFFGIVTWSARKLLATIRH
jgi:hypothetical protein